MRKSRKSPSQLLMYENLERASQNHATNREAAASLGCDETSFWRACLLNGVVSPARRKKRASQLKQLVKDWGGDESVVAAFQHWEEMHKVPTMRGYDRQLAYVFFLGGWRLSTSPHHNPHSKLGD